MAYSKRVLIDCDPGIDDALALLFAFSSDELNVKAVTTVYGNVPVRQCLSNLMKVLHVARPRPMPEIGIGADRPLKKKRLKPRGVHGKDGLGDLKIHFPDLKYDVVDAIELASAKILSGEIDCIIATGPLTNIARLITKDERIPPLLKRIYIMGGVFASGGNISPFAEFNIYNDPEAAKTIFSSDIPKTLVGLDVTRKVILERGDIKRFRNGKEDVSRLIAGIGNFAITYHRKYRNVKGAYMNDPLCVGVAVDETICSYRSAKLDVVLKGKERGRVLVKKAAPDVLLCRDVNVKRFKRLFLHNLERLCKEVAN